MQNVPIRASTNWGKWFENYSIAYKFWYAIKLEPQDVNMFYYIVTQTREFDISTNFISVHTIQPNFLICYSAKVSYLPLLNIKLPSAKIHIKLP